MHVHVVLHVETPIDVYVIIQYIHVYASYTITLLLGWIFLSTFVSIGIIANMTAATIWCILNKLNKLNNKTVSY